MKFIPQLIAIVIFAFHTAWAGAATLLDNPNAQSFISHMVDAHGFDRDQLSTLFKRVTLKPTIIETMERPYESKPWYEYRQLFIQDKRIQAGVTFWNANEGILTKAEKLYGIPAEYIVAILGVETFYGRNKGNYTLMNSLSTLAFTYPKRSKFFSDELENLLLISREQQFDPFILKGSYAGAMGLPQFMPSSYRQYAVDFSGDSKKDIINNVADAIGSIANYLNKNGWHTGEPVGEYVTTKTSVPNFLLTKGRHLSTTTAKLKSAGIENTQTQEDPNRRVSLAKLAGDTGPLYWMGNQNFSAIMSYNPRVPYALAVTELARAISKQRQKN